MKYIVFKRRNRGGATLMPVVFPNHLVHSMVAESMTAKGAPLAGYKADSAGEVSLMDCKCHGKSETLNLIAKADRDSRLLLMHDYGIGYE